MFINDLKTILFIIFWIFHLIKKKIKIINVNMKAKIIQETSSVRLSLLSEKNSLFFINLDFIQQRQKITYIKSNQFIWSSDIFSICTSKKFSLFCVYPERMSMTNIKRKKRPSSKKFVELRSKISFINNNIAKNIFIVKDLQINQRTELTITLTRFFLVISSFAKPKM